MCVHTRVVLCSNCSPLLLTYSGMPTDAVKKITFQVLRGIGFIHDSGMVHRDVKPENVLLTPKYVATNTLRCK